MTGSVAHLVVRRSDGQAVRNALVTCLVLTACPPARLAAQCPDGAPPPCARAAAATPAPATNSVAVLYFDTRDTADAYLADGLTEEIILRLQQLPRLEVKSRYASRRVRHEADAAPSVLGRSLGVRYLVNGSVQRAGDRIVVRVELTRADRDVGIWSERYDQTSGSVLDIIDAIARGVATGVAGRLLPAEATELARRPTTDPVAYEQFVRGNFYLAQRTGPALARAAAAYEASWARDPSFKPALARAAYTYALGFNYSVGDLPHDSVVALAMRTTARAVREAGDLSDTWLARGWYLAITTLVGLNDDMAGARAALAHAVELDPRSPEACHQFGQVLVILAEDSLAEAMYRRALALEPGRTISFHELSLLATYQARPADAIRWADSAIAADPRSPRGYSDRALERLRVADTAGAAVDANRGVSLAEEIASPWVIGSARSVRALVLLAQGDSAGARREAELGAANGGYASSPMPFAALGDRSRALDILEAMAPHGMRCLASRYPFVIAMRGDARFDRLTADCSWRRQIR